MKENSKDQSNKTSEENNRKALEEAINYYKHVDNFFWVISSFLMGVSVSAMYCIIDKLESYPYEIIIFDIIMILVWCWYKQFYNDCTMKITHYYKRIKIIEQQLNIIIIPDVDNSLEIESPPKANKQFKLFKASSFHKLMNKVFFLFLIIFVLQLVRYLYLIHSDLILQIQKWMV